MSDIYTPNTIGAVFRGGSMDGRMVEVNLPLQDVWLIPVIPDVTMLCLSGADARPESMKAERYRLNVRYRNDVISSLWYEYDGIA